MKEEVARISRASVFYAEQKALSEIDLALVAGDFWGIVGPNGGGKTTLIKLLLGLVRPGRGSVEVFGKDPMRHALHVGYVPQARLPEPGFPLTLLDVVLTGRLHRSKWGCVYSRDDKHAALVSLERVELDRLANRLFQELSGGQAQRGLIARALCTNSPLLLLDEPTAHVDPKSQAQILKILQTLKGKVTLAMVSHDMRAIELCADRVLYIQQSGQTLKPHEICKHFAMGLFHSPRKT